MNTKSIGFLLIFGLLIEILSFLMFYGLWADIWLVCGSACNEWPGIRVRNICFSVCIPVNGFYLPLFIIGLIFIAISIMEIIIRRIHKIVPY